MNTAFLQSLLAAVTLAMVHNLVLELTDDRGDIIATLALLGLLLLNYLMYMYRSRTRSIYPSTVRDRLRRGFDNGVSKR